MCTASVSHGVAGRMYWRIANNSNDGVASRAAADQPHSGSCLRCYKCKNRGEFNVDDRFPFSQTLLEDAQSAGYDVQELPDNASKTWYAF